MPAVYDNWGRLFEAVQRRQQYLEMAHALSRNTSTASSISLDFDELSLSSSTEESNGGSTSGSDSTPGPSQDGSRDLKTLLSSLINVKNSWWLSRSNKTDGQSGLLWYKDTGQHFVGDFSMAVVQANNTMEDQSQIESGPLSLLDSGPRGTFVGVYDGHGGPEASRYINDHLFQHLKRFTAYQKSMSADVIKNAFRATEEGFQSVVAEQWPLKPQLAAVGSCCLVGVICNGHLYIANLGDSRAVLGRVVGSKVIAVPLCTEHTPNLESVREELRSMHPDDPQIVVLKHNVWRVKGIISVSRAIGDVYLKKAEFNKEPLNAKFRLREPMKRPILTAEPSITILQLEPHDKFVICASDGLWEYLSNQEAVEIVQKQPRHGSARRLVRAALEAAAKKREMKYSHLVKIDRGVRRHFHDDITVIVVFLDSDLIDRASASTGPTLSMRGGEDLIDRASTSAGPTLSRRGGEVIAPIFNAVNDVDPSRSDWAIKVRIVRMYTNPEYKKPTETASLEMICVDQCGARIHGSVNRSLMKTFQPELHEGNIYIIRHFLVSDNLMTHKTASHKYRFNFIARTDLIEVYAPSFPRQIYVFEPFSEILGAHDVEESHLIDVIGWVVAKDTPKVEDLDGHMSRLIEVVLEDLEKNKVSCTLWGEYADELTKFFETNSHGPVIILLQMCRVLKLRGEIKISNEFYVTKMLVNEPINEIIEFRDRLLLGRNITLPRISQMPSLYDYTVAADLESQSTEFKTIEQLQALSKVGFFWVYGTILDVENVHDWWYLSCKNCAWKIASVGRKFYCEKCNRWDETGNPRFRLQVRVMDDNSNTSFLMWDRELTQLVGRTARDLRGDVMKEGSDLCLVEIQDLIGKNVLFKVQVKVENFNEEQSDIYAVVMLTDDPSLITKYLDVANTECQESDLFWKLEKTDFEEMKDSSDQEEESTPIKDQDGQCF